MHRTNLLGVFTSRAAVGMVLAGFAGQAAGQFVTVTNPATSLTPADFAPFVYNPKVLFQNPPRLTATAPWVLIDLGTSEFVTVDPRGWTAVACQKQFGRSRDVPYRLMIDSSGQIRQADALELAVPLATASLTPTGEPQIWDVGFQGATYHPLVRDARGGVGRLVGLSGVSHPADAVLALREQGDRYEVLNTLDGLRRHFGFESFRFSTTRGGLGLKHGIRHASGAWAVPFFTTGPDTKGLLMNVDVSVGTVAPDGRRASIIRQGQRVLDGNAWMELNLGSFESSGAFNRGDWRFSSTGRAVFTSDGYRYTSATRPESAPLVRAHWCVSPTGELAVIARQILPTERPGSSLPGSVFRSLSNDTLSLNSDGDAVFTSQQGLASETTARPGVFVHRQGEILRLLGVGDWVEHAPGQTDTAPLIVQSLPTSGRPQINDRGDVLAVVTMQGRTAGSVCLRTRQTDRQSGISGWIQVAGPGDRLVNAPMWRVHSVWEDSSFAGFTRTASLNNRGQVLVLAVIERDVPGQSRPVQTGAYLGFDLQRGLHLLWADGQQFVDPASGATTTHRMTGWLEHTGVGWNSTNSGIAGHFNDLGVLAVYAQVNPAVSDSRYFPHAVLHFQVQQAQGRGDLGSEQYPLLADGVLDNNDLAAFTTLFFDDSPRADVNEDGQLDGRDFARMIELFHEAQ